MPVHMIEAGPLSVCCYLVSPEGTVSQDGEAVPCVVIDPGGDADAITALAKRLNLRVEAIFLTHAHGDHIGGVGEMLELWPNALLCCSAETSRIGQNAKANLSMYMGAPFGIPPAGRILKDGEEFTMAGLQWRAIEVPGHEPGEMVYILGDGHEVFVGDTVFAGSVGRSDFPGGDHELLIDGVLRLLQSLPGEARIYPGHGPSTRADVELRSNPFLQ